MTFLIESSERGSVLELRPDGEEFFIADLRELNLHATIRVCSFMSDGFGDFFEEMAANWRGWSGEKQWSSLEGEFILRSHSDRLGTYSCLFC
jgi:hypothetical protein